MGQVLFAPALAGCTSDDVTASAAQVLSGYTALTKDSNDDPISGTMANRGAWTSSSSGSGHIAIPAGYHNGSGYVDCSGAYNAGVTAADARTNTSSANYKAGYNAGYSKGVTDADNRTNTSSANYKAGYNAGVTAADARANSSSTNYKSGYNSGYSAGRSQGQADVKANPGSYGLEAGGSYSNGYNAGHQGNAGTGDVLSGKTFSNSSGVNLTGTMANQGGYTESKSWARGSGMTYIRIPKGAYLTAGNNGLDLPEVTVADNLYGQEEYNNNYSSGYNQGVTDADNRANAGSTNYKSGYNAGKSVNAIGGCLAMAWWNTAISNSNPSSHVSWVDDTTRTLPPGTYIWAVGQESNHTNNDGCWIEVNGTRIAYVNNSDNNSSVQCGSYTLTSSANVRCRAGNYNGRGFAAFVRIG